MVVMEQKRIIVNLSIPHLSIITQTLKKESAALVQPATAICLNSPMYMYRKGVEDAPGNILF